MYATIEEGLAVYKTELKKYLGWLEPLKKGIADSKNIKITEVNHFAHFDDSDYEKAKVWSAGVVAMELVLGLTEVEIEKYLQEALAELEKKA